MNIGFAYAAAAAVTWGLVYTIDQKLLSGTSPITLLFVDAVITAVVMLPVIFFDRSSIGTLFGSGRANLAFLVLSILLACLANFFIYSGIKSVGASSASIIEISYPFFVVLFSMVFFRAAPHITFYIGGALIFIGSALITWFH